MGCCHRLVQIGRMPAGSGLMTDFQKMNKIMLVCSDPAGQVDRCLRGIGPEVVKVNDGETAIRQAHRALFDLVIVVSTGSVMDVAETVLNLTDIRPSTEIIMLREGCGNAAEAISHAFPNTKAMTLNGLVEYLGLSSS